jgi:hypothetical protein
VLPPIIATIATIGQHECPLITHLVHFALQLPLLTFESTSPFKAVAWAAAIDIIGCCPTATAGSSSGINPATSSQRLAVNRIGVFSPRKGACPEQLGLRAGMVDRKN